MPYSFKGVCYSSRSLAFDAFKKEFPILDSGGFGYLISATVNPSGLITYSVGHRLWTSNSFNIRAGTSQLTVCTGVDAPNAFDPINAGGVFSLFFGGVIATYLVAQSIGVIIQAIRKF